MSVQKRSEWFWVIPSIVVGLSCGVGYAVAASYQFQHGDAHEKIRRYCNDLHHRLKRNDSLVQLSQRMSKTPWWLLFLSGPQAKFLLWPLLVYCLVVQPEPEQKTEEEPRGESRSLSGVEQQEKVAGDSSTSSQDGSNNRYLEMLVHNVSHTDLVLSVDTPKTTQSIGSNDNDEKIKSDNTRKEDNADSDKYCLCRPRFSAFDLYSKRILSSLDADQDNIISFPRYERSSHTPRYTIVTPSPSRQAMIPTGFRLEKSDDKGIIPENELLNLRFRGRDVPRLEQYQEQLKQQVASDGSPVPPLRFNFVFFPLLATLLPRWHSRMSQKYPFSNGEQTKVKKIVILVTGVGTPRNWTHSISGNSTQACAELMERFINVLYPDVSVVRIHSSTNIFRYDENLSFAKRELLPCIDAYRDAHARGDPYPDEIVAGGAALPKLRKPFSTDWRQSFAVAISFADGSPARTHAIQSSLRSYHPTYFHFWQLKTFWHDTKICDDDIEVHSFEDMEGVPAMETSQTTDTNLELVVNEMCAFRQDFVETLASGNTDIFKFWLRKTKKPVLAVLLVEKDGKPVLYRGTNMEVSMPTGSLCAERNVIGTALATNPDLKREDLRMMAVLAVPLATTMTNTTGLRRTSSAGSFASIHNSGEEEEGDWVLQAPVPETSDELKPSDSAETTDQPPAKEVVSVPKSPKFSPVVGAAVPPAFDGMPPISLVSSKTSSPPGTPRRVINLYSSSSNRHNVATGSIRKQKRTVVVHSSEDLNPLRPCGACNEWLKKIAESNPYFKVVTFTDADCTGVYVSPCQE